MPCCTARINLQTFHDQDGYVQDDFGIHHRVLNAVVETPPGRDCYGWLDVFADRLHLRGCGDLQSADYFLDGRALTSSKA